MPDIPHLIKTLQSNNPNERYDACEQLRVSLWLPKEAFDVLRTATSDSNPDVADAAQRALALHTELKIDLKSNYENQRKNELPLTNWGAIKTGIKIGLIPMATILILFSLSFGYGYGLIFAFIWGTPMGIPGGIIGSLIGKYWKKTWGAIQIGSIIGTILGIGLWFLLTNLFGVEFSIPQ
jgi:hypothetical protein